MGKKSSGGGRAPAPAIRTEEVATVAAEYRDILERQVRVRTQTTQVAFNIWAETGSRVARRQYEKELRLRNKTIDRYEKAAERSRKLNVTMNGR